METIVTQHQEQEPVCVELLPPVLVWTLAIQPLAHAVSFYLISDIFHVTCQITLIIKITITLEKYLFYSC